MAYSSPLGLGGELSEADSSDGESKPHAAKPANGATDERDVQQQQQQQQQQQLHASLQPSMSLPEPDGFDQQWEEVRSRLLSTKRTSNGNGVVTSAEPGEEVAVLAALLSSGEEAGALQLMEMLDEQELEQLHTQEDADPETDWLHQLRDMEDR